MKNWDEKQIKSNRNRNYISDKKIIMFNDYIVFNGVFYYKQQMQTHE